MLSIHQTSTPEFKLDTNAKATCVVPYLPFSKSPLPPVSQFPYKLILLVILSFFHIIPATATAADNGDTIVITAEDIKAMQALKLADVLNNVPGVKAGSSSVSIHGSYKVKVFVDGRPINDPTSSHGAINWDLVLPEDVARMEILRGKGGLTYGQDASGGVILITTHKRRQLTGSVKAYAGNLDTRNITATLNPTIKKLTAGISGGYETTDGYKINNDKERYQAGIKLGFAGEANRSIDLSADYLYDERGLSGLPDYPTPLSRKESHNTAVGLNADLGRVTSNTHYNDGQRHNTDPEKDLDKYLRVSKFGEDLTTILHTIERGDLNCGAGVAYNWADGTGFDTRKEHSVSLFGSQSLTWPAAHITFVAGLRGNYLSAFDNVINPEVKLIYKKKIWRLTAAYSRTNNEPSLYQRYNETSSTRPNPDLEMERADNFSLAFFIAPLKVISISLTGFYNLLTDRITYITAEDGIGQYQNFGEVRYTGGDAALSWKLHSGLKAKASYTYLEVKDQKTDLWIPGTLQHNATLNLYWQPQKALSLVATGTYHSKVFRDRANTRSVPEYLLYDLRADYAFKRFSLFGEVENLFDKTYYYADGLLGPPQTWLIGVNWRI